MIFLNERYIEAFVRLYYKPGLNTHTHPLCLDEERERERLTPFTDCLPPLVDVHNVNGREEILLR